MGSSSASRSRALITRPALLLADEPTGNLDSRSSGEIMQLFEQLNQQGITVVLVTHEPDIAAHAARVLTVHDGLLDSDVRSRRERPNESVWQRPLPGNDASANGNHALARPRLSIARRPSIMAKRRNP